MELTTILNLCHHHRGFVYYHARFGSDKKSVEVNVRPRAGSAAVCSGCHKPAPGYDHLPERRFEFIPVWGFLVFFLYSMRRVQCRHCGVVVVEEVPWSDGKHQLTKAYMLFLARWARKLSWQETAEAFHTSWEKVCFAVEYVVGWGQEQHVGLGQLVLALTPSNLSHYHHATMAALDAPHAVQEKDQKPPDGDEFEAPFGKTIVTRRRLVAPRADRRRSGPRPDVHFDAFLVGAEAGVVDIGRAHV